jgi:hypothetical protein
LRPIGSSARLSHSQSQMRSTLSVRQLPRRTPVARDVQRHFCGGADRGAMSVDEAVICPIGERARGTYSGAQSRLRLRSPEKDSGSGDQSVVESLREFSYMIPPSMMVIVFCTSPDLMYPGNLAGAMVERGRLSARSADSSLPPNPAEKTRIRTSSGAEGGYLGAVRWEVSLSCTH